MRRRRSRRLEPTDLLSSSATVGALVGVPVALVVLGVVLIDTGFGDATFLSELMPWIAVAAIAAAVAVVISMPPGEIGLAPPDARRAPLGWMIAPFVVVGLTLVGWLLTLGGADIDQDMAVVVRLGLASLGLAVMGELLFRGVLMAHLATTLGLRTAMVASSVAYGLASAIAALGGAGAGGVLLLLVCSIGLGVVFSVLAVAVRSIYPGLVMQTAFLFALVHTDYLVELGAPRSLLVRLGWLWVLVALGVAAGGVLSAPDDRPRAY